MSDSDELNGFQLALELKSIRLFEINSLGLH